MAVELSALQNVLKYQYGPRLLDYVQKSHIYLGKIEKKVLPIAGKQFVFPARTGDNEGISAGAETDPLPESGHSSFIQPAFYPKQQRATVRVFVKSMDATRNTEGSWIRAWHDQIESTLRNMRRWIDAMLLGNGTGELAYLYEADNNETLTKVMGHQGPEGSHLVQNNMVVDLVDASDHTTLLLTNQKVTERKKTGFTLQDAPSGTAAGDYFIRAGSKGNIVWGLQAIVAAANPHTGFYGGIDREDHEIWQGQEHDATHASGGLCAELDHAWDTVAEISDEDPDLLLCRHSTLRAIVRELAPTYVRYTQPNLKGHLEAGWKGLEYKSTAILADPHVWSQTLLMLHLDDFVLGQLRPLGWMEDDGAIIHRVSGYAAYEAVLLWDIEHICQFPHRQMRVYNTETIN